MPYPLIQGHYPFPLSYLASEGGDRYEDFIPGDASNVTPGIEGFYIICATPEDFNDLYSAAAVGAPIAFPDNYSKVLGLIERTLDNPNSFNAAGCMDLCDLILECINDDVAIQQAIAQYAGGSGIDGATLQNQEILETDLLSSPPGCDNDIVYGMVVQFVALLDSVSNNVLEVAINSATLPGRLGDIIEAIPVVGLLPFDDIAQLSEALATDINDAYVAAYDVQLAEDISCDLFCIAKDTCTLTFEQARDYFKSKLVDFINGLNFLDLIDSFLEGVWLTDASVYVLHYIILEAVIFGGKVAGIDANRIATTIASYFNDPNSDWSTLCTTCNWTYTALSGSGNPIDDGWELEFGDYNSTDDIIEDAASGADSSSSRIKFTQLAGKTTTVTRMLMSATIVNPGTARNLWVRIYDDGDTLIQEELLSTNSDGLHIIEWEGSQAIQENWYLRINVGTADNAGPPFSANLLSFAIEGTGDSPFV